MFEFFLGCAIYFSKDLVNWSLIGNALTQRSQVEMRTIEPGTGSWASTLRYRPIDSRNGQGRFYLSNRVFHRIASFLEASMFTRMTSGTPIRESPHGIAERSHLFKRGAYYYLITPEGGTEAGHQEWVFRSIKGPYGPWESQDKPMWYNEPTEDVQRTGHADIFEDGEGNWWAVLLGVRRIKDETGRFLEPQLGRIGRSSTMAPTYHY
ncbi:hypothetical protein FOXG_15784 [Fusarium oxysporum f. sp. lycopersici 4287]|uniref:Beta-xylosidase C-terminal Concanavalin A-like domain-containing protein n=2 Tax=Fusarium oxysporum TaxID=5507 RepID=A0A0J9W518_FUSO4|nr:hypothetical protein FOXG_15784 [Fusarium oxysporum f. sp. lycopersici 4287]EXK26653.1 hypothetical protein FOMG_16715 [Fusarium oxysporum f. sp. melonis 26406]KNB18154.1 hypothetical protein FOXG_15784 [Fusarium oxysporum f. sp. lycopersici 4287]